MIGREVVTVISKGWSGEDAKGNPVEFKTEREIKNVLVAQSGSTINYGLQDTNIETDIALYLNPREEIKSTDEFIYKGRTYQQTSEPIRWVPSRGSIVKPKLIVNLKKRD